MDENQQNALRDFLENIAYGGFASVPKGRICSWYGQTSFSVTIRRDLRQRFRALAEKIFGDNAPTLRLAEVGGNIIGMRGSDFFSNKE